MMSGSSHTAETPEVTPVLYQLGDVLGGGVFPGVLSPADPEGWVWLTERCAKYRALVAAWRERGAA